jgi:hypothetical protein
MPPLSPLDHSLDAALKAPGNAARAWSRQREITLVWVPYSEAICDSVFSSRKISLTTLVLNSTVYDFLMIDILLSSHLQPPDSFV